MKGASRLDDAYDAAKFANNVDNIYDINKVAVIGRSMNRVDDAGDLYKAATYAGYAPLRAFNAASDGARRLSK